MNRGPRARVELIAVPGLPEVDEGADLAALMLAALDGAGLALRAGDVLAVASKVVAKAEGRVRPGLDHDAAVAEQTERVVAQRRTPRGLARVVRSRTGPVLAAAGVDVSNLPPGSAPLALPADPDASARRLRDAVAAATGARVGVVVTDTLGRPWRVGQVDAAIGAAGLQVVEDLAGRPDTAGRVMEVTVRALADEIAAAADLVKGKTDGAPVAVVRGLGHLVTGDAGPGAASLLRSEGEDWFRYGHAEAARAAIGVEPDAPGVAVQPVVGGTDRERLARAAAVAATAGGDPAPLLRLDDGALPAASVVPSRPTPAAWAAAGVLAQRIAVAAWAEGLDVTVSIEADGACRVACRRAGRAPSEQP